MEKFVNILDELIENSGKSLRQLEKESNISANKFSRYLRGSEPEIKSAVEIANHFECTLDYLFGLEEKNYYKGVKEYDMSSFMERYNAVLKKNYTSHYKLSKKTELSESSIRRWKKGKEPSIESLIIIAENLSVSLDYLVGRI